MKEGKKTKRESEEQTTPNCGNEDSRTESADPPQNEERKKTEDHSGTVNDVRKVKPWAVKGVKTQKDRLVKLKPDVLGGQRAATSLRDSKRKRDKDDCDTGSKGSKALKSMIGCTVLRKTSSGIRQAMMTQQTWRNGKPVWEIPVGESKSEELAHEAAKRIVR